MNVDQVNELLLGARQRIYQELFALSDALGDKFELGVDINWMSIATHDRPHSAIPIVDVSARLVSR